MEEVVCDMPIYEQSEWDMCVGVYINVFLLKLSCHTPFKLYQGSISVQRTH